MIIKLVFPQKFTGKTYKSQLCTVGKFGLIAKKSHQRFRNNFRIIVGASLLMI